MARRDENECAWCAEIMNLNESIIGRDWRVYCSTACAESAESTLLPKKGHPQTTSLSAKYVQEVKSDLKSDSDPTPQHSVLADPA